MFWGATLDGGKKYTQKVKKPFHIATAALKVPVVDQDKERILSLFVNYNDREFLLGSLAPSSGIYQIPLGVRFEQGAHVEFRIEGGSKNSRVYLTGFEISAICQCNTPSSAPNSEISVPSSTHHSILVTDKNKIHKGVKQKRVSIQEQDEEKTFKKGSISENEGVGFIENEEETNENEDLETSEDDEDEDMFDLADSEEEADFELEEGSVDEEEDTRNVPTTFRNGASTTQEKKNRKQEGKKLDFSHIGGPSLPSPVSKNVNSGVSSPAKTPNKRQKLEATKLDTPNSDTKTPQPTLKLTSSAGHTPMKTLHKNGVMITEVKIGNGQQAKSGRKVKVNYVGRLKKTGSVFDRGDIGFHLAKNEVIKGWDIGIEGMKVGGKRKLVIPPHLAYGKSGAPPDIPPNSTLVFDVELKQA